MSDRTMTVRIVVWVDDAGVWGAGRNRDDAQDSYGAADGFRCYDDDPQPVYRTVWVTAQIPIPDPPAGTVEVAGEVSDG